MKKVIIIVFMVIFNFKENCYGGKVHNLFPTAVKKFKKTAPVKIKQKILQAKNPKIDYSSESDIRLKDGYFPEINTKFKKNQKIRSEEEKLREELYNNPEDFLERLQKMYEENKKM